MPFNARKSKEKTYPINVGDRQVMMSQEQIGKLIKDKILKSRSFHQNLKEFNMSPDCLDGLKIIITELEDVYALTDEENMTLNSSLFRGGNFFTDYFYIVFHELVHFLTRKKEGQAWLNDPEEVLGLCNSAAYLIENGKNIDEIYNIIYPKIEWHFHDPEKASAFFARLIEKAKKILE